MDYFDKLGMIEEIINQIIFSLDSDLGMNTTTKDKSVDPHLDSHEIIQKLEYLHARCNLVQDLLTNVVNKISNQMNNIIFQYGTYIQCYKLIHCKHLIKKYNKQINLIYGLILELYLRETNDKNDSLNIVESLQTKINHLGDESLQIKIKHQDVETDTDADNNIDQYKLFSIHGFYRMREKRIPNTSQLFIPSKFSAKSKLSYLYYRNIQLFLFHWLQNVFKTFEKLTGFFGYYCDTHYGYYCCMVFFLFLITIIIISIAVTYQTH